MCGRYTLVNLKELTDLFPWVRDFPDSVPRYNIAPTQPILAIANDNPDRAEFFRWGLIPSWAKDEKIGNQLCNARSESLAQKNTFKNAYKRRRCLIPADGFYEWKKIDAKTKIPHYIRLRTGKPFAFAGLWETWHSPDGSEVRSATIITTDANSLVAQLHDRMPGIRKSEDYQRWLDPAETKLPDLDPLLKPYPSDAMETYPISTRVNSAKNDSPELIAPSMSAPRTLFG
jgi:putative SOS response-associated peptidase YedK